jgi:trans-aconitate 2-methyltransferase
MLNWNPDEYLRFADERSRPCRDLAARIAVDSPKQVIDLGCGPGNSTKVLSERWPKAKLIGMDASPEMINAARRDEPAIEWRVGDIVTWSQGDEGSFDLVFSNAAMQWVDNHAALFPQSLNHVAPGGALAVQMPGNYDAAPHRLMRELAISPLWRDRFREGQPREWHVHDSNFYYDALSSAAATIDLWETEYIHVLPDAGAIVEWYKGTGLRPFLQALSSDQERHAFAAAYLEAIREAFPPRYDGRVLFPFRRMFLIAYRQ